MVYFSGGFVIVFAKKEAEEEFQEGNSKFPLGTTPAEGEFGKASESASDSREPRG